MRGWIYTLFGPLLAGLTGFLPGAGIFTALKVTLGVFLIGLVSWGSVAATNWWHSDKITLAESDQRCADAISIATVKAKERALDAREYSLRRREEQTIADEETLIAARIAMEKDRAETAHPDDAAQCLPDDDGWLRRWQAQRAAAGDRR